MSLYNQLLAYETDPTNPRDGIRVIRDERQTLHVARERVERLTRSKERVPQCWTQQAESELIDARSHLADVEAEARRTLALWS